jgi:hypothetical protein
MVGRTPGRTPGLLPTHGRLLMMLAQLILRENSGTGRPAQSREDRPTKHPRSWPIRQASQQVLIFVGIEAEALHLAGQVGA